MTRQDLEQLYDLSKELELWECELFDLKSQYPVRSPSLCTVKSAGISDRVSKRGNRIADLESSIKQRRELIDEIYDFIRSIPDARMRIIVTSHCKNGDKWEKTLDLVGGEGSVDGIKKKYYRFLDENFEKCPECPICPDCPKCPECPECP